MSLSSMRYLDLTLFLVNRDGLRTIVSDNPHADFILRNGNRIQIKRKIFEKYIDSIDEI